MKEKVVMIVGYLLAAAVSVSALVAVAELSADSVQPYADSAI
jgi:hypothetical protein